MAGRRHRRPGRGRRRGRPAEPAHLAGEDHRPPRGPGPGLTEGRGGEHGGHGADPAGRRRRRGRPGRGSPAPPVPRPRARQGEIMTGLVVFTVIDIVLLIAGLAFYLYWVGTLLTRIAGNLEECDEIVRAIVAHARLIGPGVEHIHQTGAVVAGALPLLSGLAA